MSHVSLFQITEEFDEIDVAANSFLFFIAGFETSASTLSFCVYELALNQDVQEKLRSEVQQIKSANGTLSYEILRRIPYMEAVITGTIEKTRHFGTLFNQNYFGHG